MQEKHKKYIMVGVLVVCAIALAWPLRGRKDPKPLPSAPGYYAGPMRNKNNPSIYSTESGAIVPPPEGASTSSSWEPVKIKNAPRAGTITD
ncbi:MAG: hypothetical protein FJX72_14590 [Armatimonadetes bacterium]|nr:hypothetical protein [Armatimonadota bacterium]